jgi:hypothetical protein
VDPGELLACVHAPERNQAALPARLSTSFFPEDTMSEPTHEGTAAPAAVETSPTKQRDHRLLIVGIGFAAAFLLLIALNMN